MSPVPPTPPSAPHQYPPHPSQCSLLESRLSEQLWLHVDVAGNVVALGLVALGGTCRGHHVPDGDLELFNTSVTLGQPLPAAT